MFKILKKTVFGDRYEGKGDKNIFYHDSIFGELACPPPLILRPSPHARADIDFAAGDQENVWKKTESYQRSNIFWGF